MNATRRLVLSVILVASLLIGVGAAQAAGPVGAENPNPGVVPNEGNTYGALGARWWQWAFSFPAPDVPFVNTGGPVDASAGQSGKLWFLAGANLGLTSARTATVPSGVSLFFPLVNYINDYPCPDPTFQPAPGQTMEEFLQEGANAAIDWYVPDPRKLFAEIDGQAVANLAAYRATSALFTFTADPSNIEYDGCTTGEAQLGVASGYWLLLPPLAPGKYTLRFGIVDVNVQQDTTYKLTVTAGR